MNCTKCGMPTEVVDTEKFSMYVWRRRRCLKCKHRMSTHENFVEDKKVARTKQKPKKEAAPTPLPVRNVRKQIENIREYLEHRKREREDE